VIPSSLNLVSLERGKRYSRGMGGYIKDLVTATHPKENYAIALVGISISRSTRRTGLDSSEEIVKTIGAESVKIHKDLISETINLSCKMQSVAVLTKY